MSINLSKDELAEYLKEIDKEEHFTNWLTERRAVKPTLANLLALTSKTTRSVSTSTPKGALKLKFQALLKDAGKEVVAVDNRGIKRLMLIALFNFRQDALSLYKERTSNGYGRIIRLEGN